MSFLLDRGWRVLVVLWCVALGVLGLALSKAASEEAAYEQLQREWKGMVSFPWGLNIENEVALTGALKRVEMEQAVYDNDSRMWEADALDQSGFMFQCKQAIRLQNEKAKGAGIVLKPAIDKDCQAFLQQIKMANKESLKAFNQERFVYEEVMSTLLQAKPVSIESIKRGKGTLTIEFVGNTGVLKTWMAGLEKTPGRFWLAYMSFRPYAEVGTEVRLEVGPRPCLVQARLQWGGAI